MATPHRLCFPLSQTLRVFHGHARPRRCRHCHRRGLWRRDPRLFRCSHRRVHRLDRGLGRRQLDRVIAGPGSADRGRTARYAADHIGHRRRGDPAALRPDADRRQYHLGHRFSRRNQDHHPRWRQGRWRRQGQNHRIPLLCQLCRGALRGSDHRHWPRLGRWQGNGLGHRDLALVFRQRGAVGRSVHRRQDGRGQHPSLSRHGLCRVRGFGAGDLRQPPAAAQLRGVPPAGRCRYRRRPDPRRHPDPGLGRVHLCHRRNPQGQRRGNRGREPERAARPA